jgi:hypothetical protein
MQRQHTGRPGTVVIPDDWTDAPSAVIGKTMGSTVTIGAPGQPVWDDDLGRSVVTIPEPVYTGGATLMPVSDSARALTVVEDPVQQRVYDVTLPYDTGAGIEPEMVVMVDPADSDPLLAGRILHIRAIELGSRRFSRVLLAVLDD